MLKRLLSKKNQAGFTIIEVMIVMALAGLILAAVIVAVPQLQRNQRNTARKSVLSRIKTEIDSYSGNNNGNIPAAAVATGQTNFGTASTAAGFFPRYMGCTTAAGVTNCTTNINDPSTNTPVGLTVAAAAMTTTAALSGGTPGAVAGSIHYSTTAVCSGEVVTGTGATARNYAILVQLEGGAVYCLDNK